VNPWSSEHRPPGAHRLQGPPSSSSATRCPRSRPVRCSAASSARSTH